MTLSDDVMGAIINSDCYCKPGDATCEDWTSSEHRWGTIHEAVMRAVEKSRIVEDSNLVKHARKELELVGEDPEVIDHILRLVSEFASFGHSGMSGMYVLTVFNALMKFENLAPLTDDPEEWTHIAEDVWGSEGGIWQSTRCGDAFSNDGGKTYYLLSEGANDKNREPLHESEHKE